MGGCSESNSLESSKKRTRMWKLSIERVSETQQLAETNLPEGKGIFRKDVDIFGSTKACLRSHSNSDFLLEHLQNFLRYNSHPHSWLYFKSLIFHFPPFFLVVLCPL